MSRQIYKTPTDTEDKCIKCGYDPYKYGGGWLISNPVRCPKCMTAQPNN